MESVDEDSVDFPCFDHNGSEHDGWREATQVLDKRACRPIQGGIEEDKPSYLAKESPTKYEGEVMNTYRKSITRLQLMNCFPTCL